jgi:photosystem II stability/assembly factor-like uncharacterized protein
MSGWMQISVAAVLVLTGCASPLQRDVVEPRIEIGLGHVHGLAVNPGDGNIYAATHTGVFELAENGPVRIADRYQDTMGFAVAGADTFLGSGHPDVPGAGDIQLGLILSTDAARNWSTLSLPGQADFHALSVAGATVYGWNAPSGHLMRSDDAGTTWQRGAKAKVMALDVDPSDPLRLVVATSSGLQESVDGGITLSPTVVQPPTPLVLLDHIEYAGGDGQPSLAGIDAAGVVLVLDSGAWVEVGSLPGSAQAFTVLGPDRYSAATERGVFASEDAGRTWTLVAAFTS